MGLLYERTAYVRAKFDAIALMLRFSAPLLTKHQLGMSDCPEKSPEQGLALFSGDRDSSEFQIRLPRPRPRRQRIDSVLDSIKEPLDKCETEKAFLAVTCSPKHIVYCAILALDSTSSALLESIRVMLAIFAGCTQTKGYIVIIALVVWQARFLRSRTLKGHNFKPSFSAMKGNCVKHEIGTTS
jgi:hypothetical protein